MNPSKRITSPRWLSLLVACIALTAGCSTHKVGLKENLQPPPMHDNRQVKQQRKAWDAAQKTYQKRRLELRQRILVRGYHDRDSGLKKYFIMQDVSTPVHWKELFEVTGKQKLAKKLMQRQRRVNTAVGTISLVLTLAGLSVGGALVGIALSQPNPTNPGQLNPDMTLLATGAVIGGVGLVALIATFWGFTGTFGVEPTFDQVDESVKQYNKTLKRKLGLDQKAPPHPPINVGP